MGQEALQNASSDAICEQERLVPAIVSEAKIIAVPQPVVAKLLPIDVKANALGVRHAQSFLFFTGLVFGYFLRVNISAAIVPMTTAPNADGDGDSDDAPPHYNWGPQEKSLLLSSFFWGYVVAQVPSGLLAKRFGAKLVLGISTALAAVVTVLHPLAAAIGGWQLLCGLRVFVGLTQGVVYPCIHTLLAKWAPRTERSVLATTVYSGAQLGTVIVLATSGAIFDSAMGWAGIFYISGGVALIWALLFLYFGADAPATAKRISSEEREYIERLTGSSNANSAQLPVPWRALFTSVPFYGLIAAHCGFTWGFYTLLTEIPTYMAKALQLDVKANALLSALPYFAMWLLCLVVSPISDMLINRNLLKVTAARKLFNTIGQWVPMVCLIALGYCTQDEKVLAITLLTLGVGFNAASFCGYLVNHMDLSPNFAGTMMGITNGISNLLSIFAPLVVGAVVRDETDPAEWRIIFFITAGFYLCCNALFLGLGKATLQPWNEPTVTSCGGGGGDGAGPSCSASSCNESSQENIYDAQTEAGKDHAGGGGGGGGDGEGGGGGDVPMPLPRSPAAQA